MIQTNSFLKDKGVCSVCLSIFECYDSKGKLTGSSTLKRHLNSCKIVTNVPIQSSGTLAKKKRFSECDFNRLKDHETSLMKLFQSGIELGTKYGDASIEA